MGRFDNSGVEGYTGQATNPAAPEGLQQQAADNANRFADSGLQQWVPEKSYTETAQSWMTGANNQGTNNGWDNQFVDDFVSGWERALADGQARDYFGNGGTGVVTWDHESNGQSFEFGDVVKNGKVVSNVYDEKRGGFDEETANLMMAPWILDNDAQARAFSASDRTERLSREIQGAREERNENFEKFLTNAEFTSNYKETAEKFAEGAVDEGIALGGVAGGAIVAGGAVAATGVGAPVGAAIIAGGAIVGGVGAWLNRDSLTEQAARAYEITKLSYNEHGLSAGVATGIHQWSGFGGKMITPLSNLTQGIYDATEGSGGDGQSEFYRVDDEGKRKVSGLVRVADVAALVGDSFLQFASPMGAAAFKAQMSGTIVGQVSELALTGGETFDFRAGTFDNVFTDDDGNFDFSSAAAGIANVGINVAQLGMAHGLTQSANASRAAAGQDAAYGAGAGLLNWATRGAAGRATAKVQDKLPLWMGGSRGLAAGEQRVRAGGFSFTQGADGAIVSGSGRATVSLLAPSEALSSMSARVMGMRQAAAANGAYTADDFYRAANQLAVGERAVTASLVNAFGEATEEALQAVFEPMSHGDFATAEEIIEAAAYGGAMGGGMTLGTRSRMPNADEKMFAMAKVGHYFSTGGAVLTREEWNSLTDLEKRARASLADMPREVAEAAFRKVTDDQAAEWNAGVAGVQKVIDAIESQRSAALAKATDRTDGSFVITQIEDATETPAHAVAASAVQTAANLMNHGRGLAIQVNHLTNRLADLEAQAAGGADVAEEIASTKLQIASGELTLSWSQRLDEVLDFYLDKIHDPSAAPAVVEADIAELNDLLRRAFDREVVDYDGTLLTEEDKLALARAVSLVFVRDPQDQSGSFQVLLPQISARLTHARADNVLEISHAILPAISGDYDGDKIRQQAQLILDDTEFATARSGAQFIGAGESVVVGAPKYEKYNVAQLAEALGPNASVTLQSFANQTLLDIASAIRARYDRVIEPTVLDEVLTSFFDAVKANTKDARSTLLDGLAREAGGQITEFARERLSNEWLWLDSLIVSSFQQFQEAYAAHRPEIGPGPNTNRVAPHRQSENVRTRLAEKAATLGTTLGLFTPGDSMFRKFQKLHYTAIASPVLSANNLEPMSLTQMAELYRELGQRVTQSELDRVRAADDISGRVFVQLQALAADAHKLHPNLNRAEVLAVVANLRVDDLNIAEDGTVTSSGKQVSLAQMLLKQAVIADQREKARILDTSPELAAKHARLLGMTRPGDKGKPGRSSNAERAFVEVVGAQQLYALLGDDAAIFGPHLTVEQFIRHYSSLSELDRRDMARALQNEPAYLGRKHTKDMPYDLDEVVDGEVSAYRALVDAVLAVGNGRVSIDEKGKLHGEMARRSGDVSENFQVAHARVRAAIQEFIGISPRADGELDVETVQRILENNPDFARAVMNLIPDVAVNAAFRIDGDKVFAPNWLYTMFTITDGAQAEMHYWRNLLLAQWRASGARQAMVEEDEAETGRTYASLKRRMHRVMYRLAAMPDGGLLYQKFISEMESATDLEKFISWVNTTPGIRGEQAPIVPWVDDVADFDMDKAGGGWTTALPGAELREAIAMLRTQSENLVESLTEEKASIANDVRTIGAIRRVLRKDAGEDVTLDNGDREVYERFAKAIEMAGDRHVSLGPQAMMFQTLFAVTGFYAQAHTKGKNPPNVEPLGALEAQRDAFDYVTNYERLMASLTSVNLDAVGGNLAQVAKDGGRSMDDYGRPVEWTKPSVEQMLTLLESADTRPLARAVLFPQAMERGSDGVLRPQFLVGKSLTELLHAKNSLNQQMFPKNDRLSQEAAFKYVSMVEGVARKYGGHFAVQRAVNDLVIARTSAADHVLSAAELESMVTRAYHEVAQVLQAVGSIASRNTDPGTDPLADILDTVRSTQRKMRTAYALGMEPSEIGDLSDAVLDGFLVEREKEMLAEIQEISKAAPADAAEQIQAAKDDFAAFKAKVELLRTDDVAGQVVDMFTIDGDPTEQAAKKSALVEYVANHLSMLERSSASKILLNKLTQQMLDSSRNGQPDLTDKEWGELSRAVIGVYLDDIVSTTASNVSVSPWPDADREADRKYFDTSFAYLVEDMLKSTGPLAQAAKDVHRMAGRLGDLPMAEAEFTDLLGRTVLDGKRLGPWTGDIPRASIEANSRIDSAAAAPAIAMAGNSPKRQSTIIAATRRTFVKPEESLLSRATVSWVDLNRDVFDETSMDLGGIGFADRPLVQLNNRFAKTAVMKVVDSTGTRQEIDLLQVNPQLGRKWHGEDSVRDSEYSEIHLERIKRAVDVEARKLGADPEQAIVTIEFFHPDSQPQTPEFFNNVYFEGTSFKLDADQHESLIGTLWFSPGGLNQDNQRAALDASKLGMSALQVIDTVSAAERAAIEADWAVDFSAMLRSKARTLVTTDLGFGNLDVEFYNAVYKDMKLRHFVRGLDAEGNQVLMSAEQVIAHQVANPGQPLPLTEAELWVPTDDVLRSMLGEQGTQGVRRIDPNQLEVDPSRVPTYRGVTTRMLEQFADGVFGERAGLAETRIANRSRESQLTMRTMLDETIRNSFDAKMRHFRELSADIHTDRGEAQRTDGLGFNAGNNLRAAVERGSTMLTAENLSLHWANMGIPFGPRNPADTILSKALLRNLDAAMAADGFRTGWIYREGAASQPQAGLLSEVSLGAKDRPAYRVAPGDLVVVELDSFGGDKKLAKKRIDYLAERGATILLGATDGQADMRAEVAEYLLSDRQYEPIAGSQHAYRPGEFGSRYQNQKARASTLTETRPISAKSRLAVFHTMGKAVQENAAWARPANERMGSIAVSANLAPTSAMAGFNVPATPAQTDAVRAHIRGLDTAEGREFLKKQANGHLEGDARTAADEQFDKDFTALIQRFDNNPGTVLPQPGDRFGRGSFIPLVDNTGRVLLYRQGYKALRRDQIDRNTALPMPGSSDAMNVAVFPSKPEPAATVHDGEVVQFTARAGYGLQVELNIPLQQFGDKVQLEWNGMKYVIAPTPDSLVLPDHGFFPGWDIDIIGSLDDALSKEAVGDFVDNHRNAFAYFGIDFTGDVTEFFFPGQRHSASAQAAALEMLHAVATKAPRISVSAAHDLINMQRLSSTFTDLIPADLVAAAGKTDTSWVGRLTDLSSTETRITSAMLIYLMTPGAKVEDVLSSGGFNADGSTSSEMQSRLMPRLFTQTFDNAPLGSTLRTEINKRLNDQVFNPNNDGTGYVLHQDWTFEIKNADPGKNMRGFLQFAEAHSSGDNPIKNGMSFDEAERQSVSQHSAAIAYGSIGAETAYAHDIAKAQAFAKQQGIEHLERDVLDGGVWRMLTAIPEKDKTFKAWRAQTVAEAARRDSAREAMVQFRQAIDTSDDNGWSDKLRKEYGDLAVSVTRKLGLLDKQAGVVDFWVRQMLGMPSGTDADGKPLGLVSGKAAVQAAKDILDNVNDHYLPTLGAEVPQTHLHDLQMIYRANKNSARPWKPRDSMGKDAKPVSTWDDWVKVSLGSALTSDNLFDPLYLLALDGFVHTYQNATRSLMDLPVSVDALLSQQLMDPDLSRMVVSISDEADALAADPYLLDAMRTTVDELIGGRRIAGKFQGKAAPAAEVAKRRDARRKWRKEHGVPVPVDVTMKNFRKNGAEFIDNSTTTNALYRSLINLRVGTALINPMLWVSMGPEMWVRGTIDRAANLLTGQATSGLAAKAQAKVGASRFTSEEITGLNRLYKILGSRNDFKSMVYGDLHYLRPHMAGISKLEKGIEAYAKFGSRMQDPTWGMRADTLARRYMEAALQHILATPTVNVISVEQLVAQMATNPTFLRDNYPEAHKAASNAIAQIRSLKQTPLSLALRGIYEPLAASNNGIYNFLGNVVLKLPLLFSGYAMNVLTTVTGLQGYSDMAAMFLEGRQKPGTLFHRMSAKLQGKEFTPEQNATFDMSSVIEGIDLSRSFIRGNLQLTSLFALGMYAGSLGLSGEDDEAKKRRRLAEHQGLGMIYDPRKIENDFRNADAMYFDWLPTEMSIGKPHWILKQFLSPIMGFEKFYETGDFRHVGWGFQDALGSFPLVNTMMWNDAVATANELASAADQEAATGEPVDLVESGHFLTTAVGVYERMLFENSFVNQLYIAFDEYDRDPYVLPLRDSDGVLQRDIEGNARKNNLAMEMFMDPETNKLRQGYLGRDDAEAGRHVLTENRATMAVIMSLFTGGIGDSDYWRYNMPIKTRTIDKPTITKDEAEGLILDAFGDLGGLPRFSESEIAAKLKDQAFSGGEPNWNLYNQVDELAGAAAKNEPMALLSKIEDGREVLTKEGARAVLRGLVKNSVGLGHESLRGVHIPYEMRQEIAQEWAEELVQEGIDLGLDKTKATSRMKRLMYGEYGTEQVGIADLLFLKPEEGGISYKASQTYAQLNTTYVMGPDGRPWATGFARDRLHALGLKPFAPMLQPQGDATELDARGNVVDLVNGMNTGLRALEPLDDSRNVPTDVEIGKAIEDAIKAAAEKEYTPFQKNAYDKKSGGFSPWRRFGSSGGWSGGGGYFTRMNPLPRGTTPYGNSVPAINTGNPYVRRAYVRRERVWSERGRLNQWQ